MLLLAAIAFIGSPHLPSPAQSIAHGASPVAAARRREPDGDEDDDDERPARRRKPGHSRAPVVTAPVPAPVPAAAQPPEAAPEAAGALPGAMEREEPARAPGNAAPAGLIAPRPATAPAAERDRDGDGDDGDDDAPRQTGAIVVTARALDDARSGIEPALGATVYALTNDTIENRPGGETGSIAAILAQAPGVSAGPGLTVRGTALDQVRINNVAIPEAIADPADHLSARLAQTTRLLTGALPAQYGFAPAGVISVTTKNGLYQHGGQAEFFAGSDGMIEPALEWAGSVGGTSLFASGSFEHDRAWLGDAAGTPLRQRRDQVEGLAFADHVIDEANRVSLVAGGSSELRRIGAGRERGSDGYGVATYQHSAAGFTVQASLFAGVASDRAQFARLSDERRSSVGTQLDATARVSSAHTARFGLVASRAVVRETDGGGAGRAERTSLALYAQDEWKLAEGLTFNPGLRVEWLRGTAHTPRFEPRASLVWEDEAGLSLHVGYARFAAAQPLSGDPAATLADERDDYFDAGIQQRVGHFVIGVDAYARKVRDLIVARVPTVAASASAYGFRMARMRGVELSATYRARGTSAWLNLAFARARAQGLADPAGLFAPATALAAASETRLAGDRPFTASGGATQRIGSLTLSADFQVSSGAVGTDRAAAPNAARREAYVVAGAAAVYHLSLADRPVDLRLDLTNLFGSRAELAKATAMEGGWTRFVAPRAVAVGVEVGF